MGGLGMDVSKDLYEYIDPNTGRHIIFNHHKKAQKWLIENGLDSDNAIVTSGCKHHFEKQKFQLTKNFEVLSFYDFANYALAVMWLDAKTWNAGIHQPKRLKQYIETVNPNDPEIKELLLKYEGKKQCWKILFYRMLHNNLDPDIKGFHSEIAPAYEFVTKQKLPYTTLQKVLRDPSDKNIRLDKRLAILGFVLRYMYENPPDNYTSIHEIFRDGLNKEFTKRSKKKKKS